MKILSALGFIDIQPGPSGPLSYALILNPYRVIQKHRLKKVPGLTNELYNAFVGRATEIGADDCKPPAFPEKEVGKKGKSG